MPAETILQIVTVILGVLGIIWHQQHSINKLRDETTGSINKLRDDAMGALDNLREDNSRDHEALRSAIARNGERIARNGERIARIEGRLGIDPPQGELDGDDS